jgi:tetrahydrodipicolinate N-succinyltransferase
VNTQQDVSLADAVVIGEIVDINGGAVIACSPESCV